MGSEKVLDKKAWIVSANMGYGHQRTAFPLKDLAFKEKIINANDYEGIPSSDKRVWEWSRKFYEFISNFSRIPLIGGQIFSIYNHFQQIFSFYPKKDLSEPNFSLKLIYFLLKRGWGKDLIQRLKGNPMPIISTFFTPAFMAEYFNYPGEIYCVICDADISRVWASLDPRQSRIKYFAPNERAVERLRLYGVKSENIFLTGYPLPKEDINEDYLRERILNLDPEKKYLEKYGQLVEEKLGKLPVKSNHPLTLMFSVGGAGAQKEIGIKILKCLFLKIKLNQIRIILAIGIKKKVREYFEINIEKLGLKGSQNVEVIADSNIDNYFQKFNLALRKTDILWTKPSELSFYTALGIPIIISPPIGSQEEFNMRYLLKSGFGMAQDNLSYIEQWLFDWLKEGYLAEAAMKSFVEGKRMGTFNIEKIISS